MKFKKFNKDAFDMHNDNDVMFCAEDEVVRIGYLYVEYLGNGYTTYYFKSNGVMYLAENSLYLEVVVGEKGD